MASRRIILSVHSALNSGKKSCDYSEKSNPNFEPNVRYWVSRNEALRRIDGMAWGHKWLMGWRGIARATDERTLISGIIPAVASGDTFLLMFPDVGAEQAACLLANLNCLVTDFAAKQKVGGISFKLFLMRQIPVLSPTDYSPTQIAFITPKVLELTYTSQSLSPFARDLGHDGPPFAWDENRRALLRADLDAFYARAYGLTRDELRYILDPADVKGPDYPSETFRVLKEKEIRQYGEYRTRRLVLEAWDRMEAEGEFTAMGM